MNAKRIQNLMLDLVYDVVGSLIFGLGLYTFAREGGFATGGFSGLGLMLNHLTGLPIGMLTLLLNIPLIILSYRTLGRFFLLKTLKTMIIQTLILDLVMPLFPTYRGNPADCRPLHRRADGRRPRHHLYAGLLDGGQRLSDPLAAQGAAAPLGRPVLPDD